MTSSSDSNRNPQELEASGQIDPARPATIYERCNRWARRRPAAAAIIGIALAAIALLILILVIINAGSR